MSFAAGLALALSLALNGSSGLVLPTAPLMPQAESVQQYVESYFADEPVLIAIAGCESHFTQYDKDGSIYRGVQNKKDVGVMQINEFYHEGTADKLGLDLYTIEGNVIYARYLYEKQGTGPWNASAPCWNKKNKIALR